jgi:glycosyltransferase involved in cell wall biosynthesis
MKVLIVANSSAGGGAENAMKTLHLQFLKLGITSQFCALMNDGSQSEFKELVTLSRPWKSGVGSTLKCLLQFNKLIRRFKPDVVIANCELPELFCALSLSSIQNLVVVEHTTQPWNGRKMLGQITRRMLKLREASWVTVSKIDSGIWPLNIQPLRIPNCVDIPENSNITRTNFDLARIISVGRLVESKRVDWQLELAKDLKLPILVIGDGPLKDSYSKNFPNAEFLGFQDDPWQFVMPGDIMISASDFEGDGLVVIEAIVRNTPLILRNTKDYLQFQLPESMYFSSKEELKDAILRAKDEGTEKFMSPAQIRINLMSERKPESVAENWLEFIKKLRNA